MDLSVVVPIFNEEECLPAFQRRLSAVLDRLTSERACRTEIVFVDDGSQDRSPEQLRELAGEDQRVRLHFFPTNRGQFYALMHGLEFAAGRHVITLDADLQNPPEEIPAVFVALEDGHDLVMTERMNRQDRWFRRHASRLSNWLSTRLAGCPVRDHGCMLRGYSQSLAHAMCNDPRGFRFITALALFHAQNPTQFSVSHAPREQGTTCYNLARLVRYQLDAAASFARLRRLRRLRA